MKTGHRRTFSFSRIDRTKCHFKSKKPLHFVNQAQLTGLHKKEVCVIGNMIYRTPRCVVRFLDLNDYNAFIKGYERCEKAKNRFDEGKVDVSALSLNWFSGMLDRRKKEAEEDFCYMFHVFDRRTGISIGYGNIRTIFREEMQCGEIGYTVFNNYWGQGYGTEIVQALTEIGFHQLGFHRLEAFVNLDNDSSKRVLQKCGYRFECIREKYLLEDGIWTDNEIYYKLNDALI